jgi:hypothetical protein
VRVNKVIDIRIGEIYVCLGRILIHGDTVFGGKVKGGKGEILPIVQ